MSSILRALKKLEDAPPDPDGIAPWQDKFASQHSRREQSRRNPLRSKTAIVATVAVLAIVAWFTNRGPRFASEMSHTPAGVERTARPPAEPTPLPRATTPLRPTSTAETQPSTALPSLLVERLAAARQQKPAAARAGHPVSPGVTNPQARAVPPSLIRGRSSPTTSTAVTARPEAIAPTSGLAATPVAAATEVPVKSGAESSSSDDVTPSGSGAGAAITPPARPRMPVAAAPSDVPQATATPGASAAPPAAVLNRLRDPAIKLQAIAWSGDADRRMAMINDQIVHEGQTIEGYTVAAIGEESVTMRKGSEAWELRYGH